MATQHDSITLIRPLTGWRGIDLRELWAYREVVAALAVRDIKVHYKQALIGVGWVLLQPLLGVVIFTFVFGIFARLPSSGQPYPLFVYVGLIPWSYFTSAVGAGSGSLVANAVLISRIYLPRLSPVIAALLPPLVDLGIRALILIPLLIVFGAPVRLTLLAILPLTVLLVLTVLSVCVWLASLGLLYRDVKYVLPFMIQLWMFATPVVYSLEIVPESYRPWTALNPMTGIVLAFQWAALGSSLDVSSLALSVLITTVVLSTGTLYFRRVERQFADVM